MTLPYGISSLLVTCFDPDDRQFSGILDTARVLSRKRSIHHHVWQIQALHLHRRRALRHILVSGHALANKPCFTDGSAELTPENLRLPLQASLYLMGCHQGLEELRRGWARGCGLPPERILGCSGETDSSLSTCLMLHLIEDGLDSLTVWFEEWIRCNDYLRPHFSVLRDLYRRQDGRPLETLFALSRQVDLAPIESFVDVSRRFPHYLTDL